MSAEQHVRRWLTTNQTGCLFSKKLATAKGGISMATYPGIATTDDVDALFDFAASDKRPAIAVLPGIRTELELAQQLLVLASGARWNVHRVAVPGSLVTDDMFVGIEWRTPAGHWSSPMGLAPLGTMPATRRAPYTCIAAWPGGHDNKFRKRVEPIVHFLDVDLSRAGLSAEKYSELRRESVKLTTEILVDDSSANYRNVAYRLSVSVAAKLAKLSLVSK